MKRSFLPALAMAALLAGCGSSEKVVIPGRPIAGVVPPSPTALRYSAASNRAFARRDVQKLIRNVVLPGSARRVPKVPKSAPSWFRAELSHDFPGVAAAHRTWIVNEPLKDVVRYFRTHARPRPRPIRGLDTSVNRVGSRPHDDWQFQSIPGHSSGRWLNVAMLALPSGATVVTAQAGNAWIHPPPADAVIPGTVKRIDITSRYGKNAPRVRLHVRDRYDVGSVVSWMNGLGLAPRVMCLGGAFGEPVITLTFRGAGGARLARATVGNGPLDHCGSLSLTVHGRKAPLLETGDLLQRIEQRLNADFAPPLPRDVSSCLRERGWHVRTTTDRVAARKHGAPTTITFRPTGKVTISGARHPAISRCLRSSPHIGYLG